MNKEELIIYAIRTSEAIKEEKKQELIDYASNLQQEKEDYKSRIEKAVEYYKMHQQECVIGRNRDDKLIKDYYLPAQHSKVLLNILKMK